MRSYIRQLILVFLRWLGVIRIYQFVHRNEIVILMIHGVMDEVNDQAWIPLRPQLSRKKLDDYLRFLSKRYNFMSLEDAVDMLGGNKAMLPYSMVLTFDDGYRNNLTHALPILRKYKAPATFFIPTGFVGHPKPFWFDRLDFALQHADVNGREVNVGSFSMNLDSSSREALQASYKRLRHAAKDLEMPDMEFLREMDYLSAKLEEESGQALSDIQKDDNWSAVMTWRQVEKEANGNMSFGSHTVDHIRLGLVDEKCHSGKPAKSKKSLRRRFFGGGGRSDCSADLRGLTLA